MGVHGDKLECFDTATLIFKLKVNECKNLPFCPDHQKNHSCTPKISIKRQKAILNKTSFQSLNTIIFPIPFYKVFNSIFYFSRRTVIEIGGQLTNICKSVWHITWLQGQQFNFSLFPRAASMALIKSLKCTGLLLPILYNLQGAKLVPGMGHLHTTFHLVLQCCLSL